VVAAGRIAKGALTEPWRGREREGGGRRVNHSLTVLFCLAHAMLVGRRCRSAHLSRRMRIGRANDAVSCLMIRIAEFMHTVVVKRGHGLSKCSKRTGICASPHVNSRLYFSYS
jgi:hypothetical protein